MQCFRASKSGAPLPPLAPEGPVQGAVPEAGTEIAVCDLGTAGGGGISPADRQGARRVNTLT